MMPWIGTRMVSFTMILFLWVRLAVASFVAVPVLQWARSTAVQPPAWQ